MIRRSIDYIRIPKKPLFIFLGLLLVGVLIWSLRPKVIRVDMADVRNGVFEKTVTDEGITRYVDKVIITAPSDGITPQLDWKPGDKIKKGDKLLTFVWDYDRVIRSPIDGYVLEVYETDKRHVPRGTPILKIGDPDKMEVYVKFLTELAVDIEPGQPARIDNWGGEKTLEGVVVKVEPSAQEEISALGVKEQRVGVVINITSPRSEWKSLGDGYRVEASVIVETTADATLLPIGALFEKDTGGVVFQFRNGRAHLQSVDIQGRNRQYARVMEGLKPGDIVVLYPPGELADGDRVKRRE